MAGEGYPELCPSINEACDMTTADALDAEMDHMPGIDAPDAQADPRLVIDGLTGALVLNKTTMEAMRKGTTIADWLEAADKSERIFPRSAMVEGSDMGELGAEQVCSLQPFGRYRPNSDPSQAKNWLVDPDMLGEILGRTRADGDDFPFKWYTKLTKPGRVYWTVRNLRIAAHLCAGGIRAFANMQACDAANVQEIAAMGYRKLLVDWAEFEEGADGKIDFAFAGAGELTEEGLASMPDRITIDDVGDKRRTWDSALRILAHDTRHGNAKIECIKIDLKPATRAYHSREINPAQDLSKLDADRAASELNEFVEKAREIKPSIKFTVECTVLSEEKLKRVPALWTPAGVQGVRFQACHLAHETGARAIPVMLPSGI